MYFHPSFNIHGSGNSPPSSITNLSKFPFSLLLSALSQISLDGIFFPLQPFHWLILCSRHIFCTIHKEIMLSGSYLKGQGHKLGSKVKNGNIFSSPGYNSSLHGWILKIIQHKCCSWHDNVSRLTTMLIAQRSRSQTWVKGKKIGTFCHFSAIT